MSQFFVIFKNVKYVVIFDTSIFDHLPLVKKKYVFMTLFEARHGGGTLEVSKLMVDFSGVAVFCHF